MADERNPGTAADRRRDKSQLLEYLQIDIDDKEENIKDLKRFTEQEKRPTIYRVSDVFHKMNEGAYSPSVVAIGPLHRGKKHLQAMEGVKLSYMHFLFHRTENFKETQDACVDAMLEMESVARRCYADDVRLDEDDKPVKVEFLKSRDVSCGADQKVRFAKMMLIDGCFMIELFYRHYEDEDENDPILGNAFKQPAVKQDLILLENQLPFDVLDVLFRLTVERIPEKENCNRPSLTQCVLSFYYNEIITEVQVLSKKDDKPVAHVLHLLHSCYLPGDKAEKPKPTIKEMIEVIKNFKYSATELDLGGIKFEHGNINDIFDFKFITTHYSYFCFWRRGQLQIPPFLVHDSTEFLWRNFIAFEQSCHLTVKSYFLLHAFLMDKLINTAEDVHLLEKKGIIVNSMGSREEVARLFNNLCNNIELDTIISVFPAKECLEVIHFHKQLWPKFQVKLRRDYFSNPWTVISVVAASFLFVLTLMQTIYTMRS